MIRRNFLKKTTLATIAIPAIITSACTPEKKKTAKTESAVGAITDFELDEITIDALQVKMEKGELSSKSITEKYLNRINEIDKNGPKLNAVISINPDALAIAAALDEERKNGKVRGRMHGIPVLVKDNISTIDKMPTTAGSVALNENFAAKDAFIIAKLREAGAVILGKTNLSEWANFRSTSSVSGWSSQGGQSRNPYILDRNTSGSSSGSGGATSANLCAVAIGTETDGSIVSPASVNGLVGLKPTVGLLSRTGIIPISETQDTPGPMARTVTDVAILLGCLTGVDEADKASLLSENKFEKDYTKYLDKDGLKGKRIGIEKSFLTGKNQNIIKLYQNSIELLRSAGATIVEIEVLQDIYKLGDAEYNVLLYEFKDGLNRYLANENTKLQSLKALIEFNKANEAQAMPYFKQEILELSETKGDLSSAEYKDALAKSLSSRKLITEIMTKNNLDAISGVTSGLAWCIDQINGDYDTGFSFSTPAAVSGYPHITVPMGLVSGLPIGFSFMAGAFEESKIISMAYAFESALKARVKPTFKSTFG